MILNLLIAAIIIFDTWLAVRYLGWPALQWLRLQKYLESGAVKVDLDMAQLDKADLKWLAKYTFPSRLTVTTMLLSVFVWAWFLFWLGSMHAMGGMENFCRLVLDI